MLKILWLCNICLPAVAEKIGMPIMNKEGWLTGLSQVILDNQKENQIELGICFPVPLSEPLQRGKAAGISYYSFHEEVLEAHRYRAEMEQELATIEADFKPHVIHVFGTEYPHTLAMLKGCKDRTKVLVGIQGLCFEYAKYYMADMPFKIQNKRTFRDWLKQDSLKRQQEKFISRGAFEVEALQKAVHITGRTAWDKRLTGEVNPKRNYYFMNETLRGTFYKDTWKATVCKPYSIFISQGNYPIKGLHYVIPVIGTLKEEYPDICLYVAGDIVTAYETWQEKIKISAYGTYLLDLIKQYGVEQNIVFLGKLNAEEMKNQFLEAQVYLSPSAIENSPNSLGEAMLLGVPVISSRTGGVESMLEDGKEGLLYETSSKEELQGCIRKVFAGGEAIEHMQIQAQIRARETHHPKKNYERLMEIYQEIGS